MSAHQLIIRNPRNAVAALLGSLCLSGGIAEAATFAVTSTADSGPGSLRQAITDATAASGADTITFAIPGAGPHTITLATQFPGISGELVIDGFSQPGSLGNTHAPDEGGLNAVLKIELVGNGQTAFYTEGLNASLTVRGLAMRGFSQVIVGNNGSMDASQVTVQGSYIGTSLDGDAVPGPNPGNSGSAIRCGFSHCQIGGTEAWQRNLLSSNGGAAILADGPAIIEGNLIGTDASGTLALPNGTNSNWGGIILNPRAAVRIGGATVAARNVISGNHPLGIGIWVPPATVTAVGSIEIKGNFIGTDWTGTQPLPNGYPDPQFAQFGGGIQFRNTSNDTTPLVIGGFEPGEANLIAYNNGGGIVAYDNNPGEAFDNRANVIHHNRGVGRVNVDIGAAGPTANDTGDADAGANGTQNFPEILSASQTGNQLTLSYRVDSTLANSAYPLRIDVFANRRGGGGVWLTQDIYPEQDAQAVRSITLLVPAGVRAIPFVATATDAEGHSSEFSPAFDVLFEDDFD